MVSDSIARLVPQSSPENISLEAEDRKRAPAVDRP
jgi:hypothetical protein